MPSLAVRQRHPEWMDRPDIDTQLHCDALRGLERVNAVSATVGAIWAPLANWWKRNPGETVHLLDVASGAGDVGLALARRANQKGMKLVVEGCDISHTAVDYANRRAARAAANVRFFQHDILASPVGRRYDVVICSLFLHHLDDAQATDLLRRLRDTAHRLVVVSDLERSRLGFALAWLGTRLLTRSPVVHRDSLLSVRAAFTRAEADALAAQAGLDSYRVTSHWPCRWRLVDERPV